MNTTLFVPLRSNAHTLVAGAPVAAVRRRLKMASLFYDNIALEAGLRRTIAGPHGGSDMWTGSPSGRRLSWQTARSRRATAGEAYTVSFAQEATPGTPATGPYQTLVATEMSICWEATLEPFAAELPPGCDWIEYVTLAQSTPEISSTASDWSWRDHRNDVLSRELAIEFVRTRVIDQANADLALAAHAGVAISSDALHSRVLDARLDDASGWSAQAFAVPVVAPHAQDLPWDVIASLRRDRAMAQLRERWHAIEEASIDEAGATGDLEAAVHHAYEDEIRRAGSSIETPAGIALGLGAGLLLSAAGLLGSMFGPVGAAIGTAAPTIIGAAPHTVKMIKKRRATRWVSLDARLRALGGS